MTTPRDLIKSALQLGNIIDPVEDVDADEISALFDRLNRMIGNWSTNGALIYADTLISHVLTANDGEYTIGSGGDINTTRPIKINTAYIRDSSNYDEPLEIIDEHKYSQIYLKSLKASRPDYLYYNPDFPLGTVKIWPLPSLAFTLFMDVNQPLTAFTGLSQTISLPPGYEEAIEYNFLKRIIGSYNKKLTPEQADIADDSLADIKRANRMNDRFESDVCVPAGQGGTYFDVYGARRR